MAKLLRLVIVTLLLGMVLSRDRRIRSSATTDPSSLGQGFFIPSKNMLGEFFKGAIIFENIAKECVSVEPRPETRQVTTYFKSTETFYEYLSTKTGISAKYQGEFTMKTTLKATTKSISGGTLRVSGLTYDIYALKESMVFSQHCINTLPLSKAFLDDFQKLPAKIADPNNKNDWLPYHTFLTTYGSHIVTEINRGSRLRQWTFASSTEKYSERDFKVRACIKLSWDAGSLDLDGCSDITSKEKETVAKMTMSDWLDLKGGSAVTRAELHETRSADLIKKFLVEAQTSPDNLLYKFTSVWQILKERYLGLKNDDLARSLNMEAYYSAVLDFGCTKQSDGSVPLRWLEQNGASKLPDFSCKIAALGCQSDNDCHIGGAGSVCYCYGSSCVDDKTITDPNSKIKDAREIRRSQKGSYDEGINNSCHYRVGVHCDCDKNYASPVVIWPPSRLPFFFQLPKNMIQRKMKCLPGQLKRKCLRN